MTAPITADTRTRFDVGAFVKKYAIIGILLLFVILLAVLTQGSFLQPQNLINVIRQVSAIAIIATGMTFVIIINGIDLSVGSIVAVSAVVASSLAQMPDASVIMYPGLQLPVIMPILAGLLQLVVHHALALSFGVNPHPVLSRHIVAFVRVTPC